MRYKDVLNAIQVKQAKLPEGKKRVRLTDGEGLYLLINDAGKYWRLDYRFKGIRKTISLGVYPDVTLANARKERRKARTQLDSGIDPSMERQATLKADTGTFEAVAREWFGNMQPSWKPGHAITVISRLEANVFPWLGNKPINGIEPPDLLAVLRRIESRGAIETAHRVKSVCGQVFRYGVATGRCKRDPTPDLRGALKPVVVSNMATITRPDKIGELLRAIEGYTGTFPVKCALQLAPYLFVRPGELRHAEWNEINLDSAQWKIPANKMKMKRTHLVPLSKQVIAILRELKPLTGVSKYIFPSVRSNDRPMSENTINGGLRRMGFDKTEICGHGFRAMASTILHEQGYKSDVIERQLAHVEGNKIKGVYNHAEYLPERTQMMQAWADYLDGLRQGADVVNIHGGTKL